jgi:hypothetical protein
MTNGFLVEGGMSGLGLLASDMGCIVAQQRGGSTYRRQASSQSKGTFKKTKEGDVTEIKRI